MTVVICEMCTLPVSQNDGTTIHLEHKGIRLSYTFHNRGPNDCLAQKIKLLREQFNQPAQQPQQ
jgi:predicted dithiol-disulfide oxidoreductase (DUF899 family)